MRIMPLISSPMPTTETKASTADTAHGQTSRETMRVCSAATATADSDPHFLHIKYSDLPQGR